MTDEPALVDLAVALEVIRDRPGGAILDPVLVGQVIVQAELAQVGREDQHAVGGQAASAAFESYASDVASCP